MATNSSTLRSEVSRRHLTLVSGYVQVALKNPEAHAQDEAQALKVVWGLAAVGDESGRISTPFNTLMVLEG